MDTEVPGKKLVTVPVSTTNPTRTDLLPIPGRRGERRRLTPQVMTGPPNTKNEGPLHLRPSPYRAVNTLRLCYKNQPVNAV